MLKRHYEVMTYFRMPCLAQDQPYVERFVPVLFDTSYNSSVSSHFNLKGELQLQRKQRASSFRWGDNHITQTCYIKW